MYGKLPNVTLDGVQYDGVVVRAPDPAKSAVLRLPTNRELRERMDGHRTIRRSLGRRKLQDEPVSNTKADLALFQAIRLDKGPKFDEAEASNAVSKMILVDVSGCERVGNRFKISLTTAFGDITHLMNIPFQRDIQTYRRTVMGYTELPHGLEEILSRSAPPCDLYDATVVGIEGYAEETTPASVPPHHKAAVVVELIQAMDEDHPAIEVFVNEKVVLVKQE